jgi:molybdopterin-containing oxidoreductase family membrane subunit
MANEALVMGLFTDENQAVSTVEAIADSPWQLRRVHSPIPSHKLSDALNLKPSMVGWYTLAGGITGFFTGFIVAAYTAVQWNLIVSGKPIVALVPFFIVGFEFTVLFAIFGNVIGLIAGLIHQMQLPGFKGLEHYDPRCSGEHFGITASCEAGDLEKLKAFFQTQGGEVKVFSA